MCRAINRHVLIGDFLRLKRQIMPPIQSRCGACGRIFESRKALRNHIDKEHRITDSKLQARKEAADDMQSY